jgi:hypothetical protein
MEASRTTAERSPPSSSGLESFAPGIPYPLARPLTLRLLTSRRLTRTASSGVIVKVVLDDGSVKTGSVVVAPKLAVNRYTDAGLGECRCGDTLRNALMRFSLVAYSGISPDMSALRQKSAGMGLRENMSDAR